jgi:integrase
MPRKAKRRTWGSGSLFERNGRWRVAWHEGGRRRSKSFVDKDLAQAALAQITAAVARGESGMPKDYAGTPTLAELAPAWLERRAKTHRDAKACRSRWKCHLLAFFGRLRPSEVDSGLLRQFIEQKLGEGLSPTSVGHFIRHLSTWFADLIESGHLAANPVAGLPRKTRRLYRSTYDTTSTPFLQTTAAIRAVYLALPEPYSVAFACGALGGLRTGECLGLSWPDVDLEGRRLHIRQQMQDGRLVGLKDDEPRAVPLLNALLPILQEWRLKTGGAGPLFKPANPRHGGRPDLNSPSEYIRPHTLHKYLRKALDVCGLPRITWYHATRHTFASQWVINGGSIETLSKVMGHSSTLVTQRYAHLRLDLFADKMMDAIPVDLARPAGTVVQMPLASTVRGADSTKTAPPDTVDAVAQIA